MRTLFFLLLSICLPPILVAEDIFCELPTQRHHLAIGPEVYYLSRTRKQGTHQDGWLCGGRLNYDYFGRYLFYFGCETAYANGNLKGHSGNGTKIKSNFSDFMIEGRVGYTFQSKSASCARFTPFIGYGQFIEWNNYVHPTPLRYHFRNTFSYVLLGALCKVFPNRCTSLGLN